MKINRNILILLCLLILINLGGWIIFFKNKPPRPERLSDFLDKELKLNESQQIQYHKLRDMHRKAVETKMSEMLDDRKLLFIDLAKEKTDSLRTDSIVSAIASKIRQIEYLNIQHFEEIKSILNKDQKERYNKLLPEIPERLQRPGRRPPN
jgi:hypothetical protein